MVEKLKPNGTKPYDLMKWTVKWKWTMTEDYRKEYQQVYFMRKNWSDLNHKWIHDLMEWWKFTVWDSYYANAKENILTTDGSVTILTLTLSLCPLNLWRKPIIPTWYSFSIISFFHYSIWNFGSILVAMFSENQLIYPSIVINIILKMKIKIIHAYRSSWFNYTL